MVLDVTTDYCDDTPVQLSASTGDPVYPKYGTCGGCKTFINVYELHGLL